MTLSSFCVLFWWLGFMLWLSIIVLCCLCLLIMISDIPHMGKDNFIIVIGFVLDSNPITRFYALNYRRVCFDVLFWWLVLSGTGMYISVFRVIFSVDELVLIIRYGYNIYCKLGSILWCYKKRAKLHYDNIIKWNLLSLGA